MSSENTVVAGNSTDENVKPTGQHESDTRLKSLWPGYEKYFELIKAEKDRFLVKCLLCVNSKQLSTQSKSSYNLNNHVEVKGNCLYL